MAIPWLAPVARSSALALTATLVLMLALAHAPRAFAATPYVITTCTTQSLVDALNFMDGNFITDGLITFNCGGSHAPATIGINQSGGYNATTGAAFTIDGGNNITLTGNHNTRLFFVQSGAALTLANILLTDGYAGTANGGYGGAVYVDNGALALDHATIQNSHTNDFAGSAIYAAGGQVSLINGSVLQGNYGASYGAINSTGAVTIVNSTLQNNGATTGGGALSVGGTVSIRSSQLFDNGAHAGGKGGALFVTNLGRVTIVDSTITANGNDIATSYGAGIYNMGALTVSNTIFNGNYALQEGGAIYNDKGRLTLGGSTFLNNIAVTDGGAIYNFLTTVTLNDSLFGVSVTGRSGGALYNLSGTAVLTNVTISASDVVSRGGGIYNAGTLTVTTVTLSGNRALNAGGGLYNNPSGQASINDSLFASNIVTGNSTLGGGGIYNQGTLIISNSTLSGNAGGHSGGGIFNAGTATLYDSTLNSNSAATSGGAIENQGIGSLFNSALNNNTTGFYGGGIKNDHTVTLNNSTLSANYADFAGGGIYNVGIGALGVANLVNSTLSGNKTWGSGGGIENIGKVNLFNSTIVFNQADSTNVAGGVGGGVHNVGTAVHLTNTLVAGNLQGNGTNDCTGTVNSHGRNLFYVVSGCTIMNDASAIWSFLSTLASIGPLQNNGGPTQTHMPRLGSQMIDGGPAATGCLGPGSIFLLSDQRGKSRPVDGDGNGSPICDVGAVERQPGDSDLPPRLYLPLLRR